MTPSHIASSPSTPKSPKVKPKPRQPKRKASAVKTVPPPVAPVASTSTPAAASTPAVASPAAATPAATAEPSTAPVETGQKRRREEEPATPVAQPSPPKKVKTDWEASSSTEVVKKEEEPQNVNTLDDSLKYLQEKQDEYRAIDSNPPTDESLHDALLELNKLFSTDGSDISFDPQPAESANDGTLQMFDFFDLDAYETGKGNPGSLAPPTPELSHSTNPSPASVGGSSDGEHGGPSTSTYHSDPSVSIVGSELTSTSDLDDIFQDSMFSSMKGLAGGESLHYTNTDFDYGSAFYDDGNAWAIS